jgi:hypothetical protein
MIETINVFSVELSVSLILIFTGAIVYAFLQR